MSKKIAIQGVEASFHAIAAHEYFNEDISLVACDNFAEVFLAVKSGRADLGVAAIENSLFGAINDTYDLLLENDFWISGEIYLRIEQCLIGLPGANIKTIREVYSHPVALAQCEEYLDNQLGDAKRFEHHDTAGAVADVKQWGDPAKAAIASKAAAKLYGLEVLAEEIETHKQNYTRFVVLGKNEVQAASSNKTSLVLVTDHKPGALYGALGAFAEQNIDLTKLQSRPIIGQAWHYMFYVDVSAGINSNNLKEALAVLKSQNCEVTVLGSYSAGSKL